MLPLTGFVIEALHISAIGHPPWEQWRFVGYNLSSVLSGEHLIVLALDGPACKVSHHFHPLGREQCKQSFLVVTAPEIHDELRERATDPEVYIQRMIKEQLA